MNKQGGGGLYKRRLHNRIVTAVKIIPVEERQEKMWMTEEILELLIVRTDKAKKWHIILDAEKKKTIEIKASKQMMNGSTRSV